MNPEQLLERPATILNLQGPKASALPRSTKPDLNIIE
jgi:hypothetical protein